MMKFKISKFIRALRTYMAGFGTMGNFPGTYFCPGGGGVPNALITQGYFVKEIMNKISYKVTQLVYYLLDRKAAVITELYRLCNIVACFCQSVNALFTLRINAVTFKAHFGNHADDYANQKCIEVYHSRGPPLSLAVSMVCICPY